MQVIGFYLCGKKGLFVLQSVLERFGKEPISYVVAKDDVKTSDNSYSYIKALCEEWGLTLLKNENEGATSNVTLKFAVGWRHMLGDTHNLVVLHDSLLPKYRGFAPLVSALVNGDSEVGVSAILANHSYDSGDIIGQLSTPINYPITIRQTIDMVIPLYQKLVIELMAAHCSGKAFKRIKQLNADATYSLWRDRSDYFIDWSWSASKVARFVDAVGSPYEGARALLDGKVVVFGQVSEVQDVNIIDRPTHTGKIIFKENDIVTVVCGSGLVRCDQVRSLDGKVLNLKFRSRFE